MQYALYHKWLSYFFFGLIFFTQAVNAQYEEKDFVRYSVKDGLTDNYITSMQQDSQGYMWIGTPVGLNRYDGNSFNNFYQGSSVLPLRSSSIMRLKIFENNQLGILNSGGFQLLNTKNFALKNYYIPDTTAFISQRNATWDAIQIPNGSFAVTTAAGFQVYDKSGKVLFLHDAYSLKDVGKKRILYGRNIFSINHKEYLIYIQSRGLVYYNHEKKIYRDIAVGEKEWEMFCYAVATTGEQWIVKEQLSAEQFIFSPYNSDSIIFYDHHLKKVITSRLPFLATAGLNWESKVTMLNDTVFTINAGNKGFFMFHINRQTGRIVSDGKRLMPGHKIISLFFDKDKRLWIGTTEGLLRQKLDPALISAQRFPNPEGLAGEMVCTYTHKNKLYAGRFSILSNGGLLVIDPANMQIEKEIKFYGGHNRWNEIMSIEMYHPDTLWIGTTAGVLWFDTRSGQYGRVFDDKNEVRFTMLAPPDNAGFAWMCSYLGGVVVRYNIYNRSFTRFTSQTTPALPFDKVKSIAYDSYGDVWIGGHSLTRWNSRKEIFDTLITVYGGANKFNDNILALSADNNGSLWLHNAANGLLEYNIKEKKFTAYSMNDGLPSDALKCFSPVIDNVLWLASNNHLTKFDTKTKKIFIYDQHDGLPESNPTSYNISFDKVNRNLFMCSNEYISKFPLEHANNVDKSSDLLIQELIINYRIIFFHPSGEFHLKYNENNLTINFAVIDFEKSNSQFAYKINDATGWNSLGRQRSINLYNLSPGKYLLQIKAYGKSSQEKIKQILLIVKPPFWKTAWFLIACFLLVFGLVYIIYRRRVMQVRQKADIDKLLAQTEMKALHAQMNPHFIFNSLNSIREMILNNENKDASHYLSKFAHLIRITLDQSGQTFISLRNTVDYLKRYIEMEKIRNNNFTCDFSIDAELDQDETLLPPMLIQPFIENAIWHGASGDHPDIAIKVDFKKEHDNMVCTIDDDGIGIDQSLKNKPASQFTHESVGITNIKNRIRLLNEKYHLHSTINITDKTTINKKGTLVILQLPLEIKEA